MGRPTLTRAPIQELYNPAMESVASLDDLQRSWETLKNVVRMTFLFNSQMHQEPGFQIRSLRLSLCFTDK